MTPEQMRDEFLRGVVHNVNYWLRESRAPTAQEKLEGLAFSMLVMLDGGSSTPGCQVIPNCDEDGWSRQDIGGGLHEHFHRVLREVRGQTRENGK